MSWLSKQFSEQRLFRRLVIIYCCVLVWVVTEWSFTYAAGRGEDYIGTAAVISAIQLPITALFGYLIKLYPGGNESK